MDEFYEYRMATAELLAATVREVVAGEELSAACEAEVNGGEWLHSVTQQKRQAVYAADTDREEAAERFVAWYRRVGGDPLSIPTSEQATS